jgi:cell division protein FtsI/penicillin-binding protein 2
MMERSWRFNILGAVFGLLGVAIFFQTIRIQFSPQVADFLEQSDLYSGEWQELAPPRGQIYDRWGHLLAGNKVVYEVGVELRYVEDPRAIAIALNGVLELDYNQVVGLLRTPYSDDAVYVVLSRAVSAEKVGILQEYIAQQQEALNNGATDLPSLDGLVFRPSLARAYPENDLASTVLGFVSVDGDGYYGVEQYYNHLMAGLSQKVWIPYDPNRVAELPDIPPGASLVLTIDREVQAMVEEELDKAVELYGASAGTVVIMNPQNGEILAMASTPRLNLNEYWRYEEIYPDSTPFNRATSKSFEPGSVFKIFTMASALDNGSVKPDTTFLDTGVFQVGGITIKNWDAAAWGIQDMVGCLRHSLNVCLAWVGSEMGANDFYSYMNAFGFGHFTGVDIAGEATGRLKAPGDGDWWPADLGTNTFGQGISVTPIQIMQAASALANNGEMVVPHVVLSIVDNGNQYPIRSQIAGQPISAKTAHTLTDMLAVSLEQEASVALVPGYRVAGKTGTAEIPTPDGYSRAITNASFIGWGPVDDPQFVVYVWLEEPTASIWGSTTAAPAFSQIVQRLVVLLNIPPDSIRLSFNEP